MKPTLLLACAALLAVCLVRTDARGLLQAAGVCPIDVTVTELDFSGVATDCADSGAASFCSSCICALTGVYAPALAASGVDLSPAASAATFPLDTATSIISACTAEFFAQMLLANVNTTALQGLTQCDYSNATALPPCLGEQLAALTPATADATTTSVPVTASARVDDTTATAAPTLRVATVLPTATGAQITLAGQLDSASQLLAAMVASTDLRAALPLAKQQALDTLAASSTTFDSDPSVADILSKITADPFSADSIIDELSAVAAKTQAVAAPASSAAANAPAATPAVADASILPAGEVSKAPANGASSNMLGFAVALLTAGAALAIM